MSESAAGTGAASEPAPRPVVVCGFGSVGHRVVELLHRLGERVVVVSRSWRPEWHRWATDAGVTVIEGDVRDPAALERAGVGGASALLALTDDDLVNIEVALDARRLNPGLPIVVRLFDPVLARQLEESFHLRRALGMATIAAPRFAAAAIGAELIATFEVRGEAFVVGRVAAAGGDDGRLRALGATPIGTPAGADAGPAATTFLARRSDWARSAGVKGAAAAARRRPPFGAGLRALAETASPLALRLLAALALLGGVSVVVFQLAMGLSFVDALYFVVTTLTTTGYGDITPRDHGAALKLYASLVMVLGSAGVATVFSLFTDFLVGARFRKLAEGREAPERDHVVVAGLGDLGLRVAEELLAAGVEVAVVERDPESPFVGGLRERSHVVAGDARQPELLGRAGIPGARAVVCAAGNDTVNLSIALAARRLDPRIRTVVRIVDPELAGKVEETFRFDAALGPARIAAPTFVASALERGVQQAVMVGDTLWSLSERLADRRWIGRRPSELAAGGTLVAWREPGGRRSRSPSADDGPIYDGERLLLALPRAAVRPAFA